MSGLHWCVVVVVVGVLQIDIARRSIFVSFLVWVEVIMALFCVALRIA